MHTHHPQLHRQGPLDPDFHTYGYLQTEALSPSCLWCVSMRSWLDEREVLTVILRACCVFSREGEGQFWVRLTGLYVSAIAPDVEGLMTVRAGLLACRGATLYCLERHDSKRAAP